ncbi:MAG: nucleotide exchange factor GrpE [Gammaproteobacteria bacterium]|nr:nucleotide exchange factor GrpE [Gammaproteobacteria bacterium]
MTKDPDHKWQKVFNKAQPENEDKLESPAEHNDMPTGPIDPTYSELKQSIEDLKAKVEANWDKYLREVAEKDNVRKRLEQEVQKMQKYGTQKLIEALLPALDGLNQGLENSLKAVNDDAVLAMREGLALTDKMIMDALGRFGVEPINPLGEKYDPQKHEAIAMQPSADYAAGFVMAVIQRGYILHGRVVRPARVIVVKEA